METVRMVVVLIATLFAAGLVIFLFLPNLLNWAFAGTSIPCSWSVSLRLWFTNLPVVSQLKDWLGYNPASFIPLAGCTPYYAGFSEDKETIFNSIATGILDCWARFGMDKGDPIAADQRNPFVCKIVSINLSDRETGISYADIMDYLASHKPPGYNKTYNESGFNNETENIAGMKGSTGKYLRADIFIEYADKCYMLCGVNQRFYAPECISSSCSDDASCDSKYEVCSNGKCKANIPHDQVWICIKDLS